MANWKVLFVRGIRRNGALSLAQGLLGTLTYLVLMRALIADHGTEAVGLWSLTLGVVAFVRLIDISGTASLTRLVAISADDHFRQVALIDSVTLAAGIFFGTISILLFLPFGAVVAGLVGPEHAAEGRLLVVWALGSLVLTVVGQAQSNALDGLMRADLRAIISIAGYLLFLLLGFFLIPGYGVFGLAAAQVANLSLVLFLSRLSAVSHVPGLHLIPLVFRSVCFKEALEFSFRVQLGALPMGLLDPLSRMLIGQMAGLHSLAVYDLAYKVALYTMMLVHAALTPVLPVLSQRHSVLGVHDSALIQSMLGRSTLIAGGLYTLLCLGSPILSLLLFDEIDKVFLATLAALAISWCIGAIGLVPQFATRAAGILRWSIIGNWSMIVIVAILGISVSLFLDASWAVLATATAIGMGNTIGLLGNAHVLGVKLWRTGRPMQLTACFTIFALSLFFVFGLSYLIHVGALP